MNNLLILLGGVACAAIGGELFVRGVVGLARWARIAPGIIAATFAAFATSSPELSVSITSALAQKPQIALGDALGSNVVNISLILGLALLISPIKVARDSIRRDFPVAIVVPLVIGALAYDGVLTRSDGVIMLTLFVAWLAAVIIEVRRQRSVAGLAAGESRHGRAILSCLVGLVFLVASGRFIVMGAKGIALAYGIDEFVIGATLVAAGTSAPELATALIAKIRGHDDIGIGTLLGSNIFNGLLIVAIAALIYPIHIAWAEVAIGLFMGLLTTLAVFPGKLGTLGRERGLVLIGMYAVYVGLIFQ